MKKFSLLAMLLSAAFLTGCNSEPEPVAPVTDAPVVTPADDTVTEEPVADEAPAE